MRDADRLAAIRVRYKPLPKGVPIKWNDVSRDWLKGFFLVAMEDIEYLLALIDRMTPVVEWARSQHENIVTTADEFDAVMCGLQLAEGTLPPEHPWVKAAQEGDR